MNVNSVVRGRYDLRDDIVEVYEVLRGKTPRSGIVKYTLRVKVRPRGQIDVGGGGEMGVANFSHWATLLESYEKAPRCRYCTWEEAGWWHQTPGESDHTLGAPKKRAPRAGTAATVAFWRKHPHTFVAKAAATKPAAKRRA